MNDRSDTEPGAAAPPPDATAARNAVLSRFALFLALVATAVAGSLWWQYRQFYLALDSTDAETAVALERVRADLRGVADDVDDAVQDLTDNRRMTVSLQERVEQVPGRFADVERRLDVVQGGSFDARSRWLHAEAAQYLSFANAELVLGRRFETAMAALAIADGRLAELGDPALGGVREQIAGELQALEAVRRPDIEGTVFALRRLAARVDDLPPRTAPVTFGDRTAARDAAEPGVDRLFASVRDTLSSLVRVERRDEPVAQALSAAEVALARRQLALELSLAQLGALRAEQPTFDGSLRAAAELLRRDFAAESREVEGALVLLGELRALNVAPELPDISGSLLLLRSLTSGVD